LKVFCDTNVLVAASERSHPHHAQAWPALHRVATGQDRGFMSSHSIAETYSTLTRLPLQPHIHPSEAARVITDNILPNFEVLTIGKKDYLEALRLVGSGGWIGAKIYDALLIGCAVRSGAERIYTFDLSDFAQLAPELEARICAPS
jgi:predicted nucleic acid-binding protein